MKKFISSGIIDRICREKKSVYVYGIGYMYQQYESIIPRIDGYIVTDGHEKPELLNRKKVYYLSEIREKQDIGVIVCVEEKNQPEIIEGLHNKGIESVVCI